jgi:hypothetical protein
MIKPKFVITSIGAVLLAVSLFFSNIGQVKAIIICNPDVPPDEIEFAVCCGSYGWQNPPCNNCDPLLDIYCTNSCDDATPIWGCVDQYICDPSCVADPTPSPIADCPNGSCGTGETCYTCEADCGACPSCPDGTCNNGETCSTCPDDCGACVSCGDGICNNYETCSSCSADCGACVGGCDPVVADVKADGSDAPITVYSGQVYTISWSSTFATYCSLEGSDRATSGSIIDSETIAGTYYYDLGCYSDCSSDADRVTVEVSGGCGDGSCSGFENCLSCPADCGACPAYFSWWQTIGGHAGAETSSGYSIFSFIPSDTVCLEPSCYPYLFALDRAGVVNSDGFPLTRGAVMANDRVSARGSNVSAIGTTRTRFRETYSYFYSKYSLGLSPVDDYSASAGDALEPVTSKDAYFHSGDMTIQSPWDVTSGESYVVFVDGDLNIEDPLAEGELIEVAEGGFLAFIVSGDINIADSVGHSVLTNITGNIEGVYIADGTITFASNGAMDNRFIGEGTFAAWTDVSMLRSYDEGANNDLYPTETFVYRPDFVKNTPEKMKRAQMLWQETN